MRAVLLKVTLGLACVTAIGALAAVLLFWRLVTSDDPLVTVVNGSGSVVTGELKADKTYSLESLAPDARRRVAYHHHGEAGYWVSARLRSGQSWSQEGPYHVDALDLAEDGPDQETIAVVSDAGVTTFAVDDLAQTADVDRLRRLAGYAPDRRVVSPSGRIDAVIRLGPSLRHDRAWRILLVQHGKPASSGAAVFEATDVQGLSLAWTAEHRLVIRKERATVSWSHPLAVVFDGQQFVVERVELARGGAV